MACIYSITHTQSGKIYIGKTKSEAVKRWKQHRYELRKGIHHNKYLQRAWNKYKSESFEWKILEEGEFSHKELCELEYKYIQELKTCQSEHGYNLTGGGEGSNPSHSTFFERTKSPAWTLAQDIYLFWKNKSNGKGGKYHPGSLIVMNSFNLKKCRGAVELMLNKFKEGWVPIEDKRWLKVYSIKNVKPKTSYIKVSSKKGKEYWSSRSKDWKYAKQGFDFWVNNPKPSIIKLKNSLQIGEGVAKEMAKKFKAGWNPVTDLEYLSTFK